MPRAIPVATYRLQLTKDFDFKQASALVPYLKALGISHLYASPFLAARPGSTHGYDIVDHNRFNPELGGEDGFEEMSAALRDADMGLILDFVPNHMGVGFSENAWWLDVLEWGPKSPHAASFDIDWYGLPYRRQPGVLLPILGEPYGDALRQGRIQIRFDPDAGTFSAWYFDHKLPVNPQRYSEILRTVVAAANAEATSAGQRLLAIAERYREHSSPSYSDAPLLKHALAEARAADVVCKGLAAYRGDTDEGWALLHRLLERQAYHLAYWRVAFSAINYRRFFDINDLAGVRPEHPATFHAMHTLVARLIAENKLQGIRLDHIDGLRDPAQYTRRLLELIHRVRPQTKTDGFYILIEKILAADEPVPQFRGVDGTTGYERLNLISDVLLDAEGLPTMERTWREFTGEPASFQKILAAAKSRVLETMLASEFTVLTRALGRIAAGHYSSRDYIPDRLRAALRAYVIEFPIYRTYVTATRTSDQDRRVIKNVISRARRSWTGPDPDIFDFLCDAVTCDLARDRGYSAKRVRDFALKLQQFTGPLMAKSLEDTAFYRYGRLLALNEVGGDPAQPRPGLEHFHLAQIQFLNQERHGLVTTATHDTKRGEDGRMRILALAEMPNDWDQAVHHWAKLNTKFLRRQPSGARAPSAGHEYMLYQTLIGAWPDAGPDGSFRERVKAYALKAAREGKQETSWTNPDADYEAALTDFVAAILDPDQSEAFIRSFSDLAQRTALLGALNSLSQLALKFTLPGVPDLYQGTELWDFSLVDPDNRRPVHYGERGLLLTQGLNLASASSDWRNGQIKFALSRKLLEIRREHADVFAEGDYAPLKIIGRDSRHIVGYIRRHQSRAIAVVVGRHFGAKTDLGRVWPHWWDFDIAEDIESHVDLLRDRRVSAFALKRLFDEMPLAILALPGEAAHSWRRRTPRNTR